MENVIQESDGDAVPGAGAPGAARMGFAHLGLGPAALRAVAALGYEVPTAVQERVVPLLLEGRDVVAQAPTGTGKTAGYGLPIVDRLMERDPRTQALVLVPTRELAIQIAEALQDLGGRRLVALPIYGGQPYDRQLRALARGVQVVVGTPGRLLDHLGRGALVLDAVRTVVLDEADEMLDMGFLEDIEKILAAVPTEHQTALFSATIPARIKRLAEQYLRDPKHISVEAGSAVAPMVRQVYYEVPWTTKPEALARILELEQPDSAIVFVRTRRDADLVAEQVDRLGYAAQAIHGDITQGHRERVLDSFRTRRTRFLIGTDVAARGLDIPDVSHVINYDLPADAEGYVHRIGRTGRAGQAGEAVTLVTPRERRQLVMIERGIHRRLEQRRLPTDADLARRRRTAFRAEVAELLDAGGFDPFVELANDLSTSHDLVRVAAAALKLAAEGRSSRSRPRNLSVEAVEMEGAPAADGAPTRQARERAPGRIRHPSGSHQAGVRRAEPSTRLFLRIGRRHGVRPADVVGAIANEAGIPSHSIGDIHLFDTFLFVDVPEMSAGRVEAALNRTSIRGHAPRVSLARPAAPIDASSPRRPSFRERRARR